MEDLELTRANGVGVTSKCRHCNSKLTVSFCDLGMSPLANSYLSADQLDRMEPFYPLHAYVCADCFLVQFFIAKNVPVLGIEPAAKAAEKIGIPTLVQFFNPETATSLRDERKQADLLLGNNVLAHVPDLNDFVSGMKIALKPRGIITMEFPHLLRPMPESQFDTIYHEHFSYLSIFTVERVFAEHGLRVFEVEEVPTHGGSLRIFATHAENDERPTEPNVEAVKAAESAAGLQNLDSYRAFSERVKGTKRSLLRFLVEAREQGKSVVGYGAPAKGNTLLNYCGVRTDLLDYTVDRSPHKQDRFLPGVHVPIYGPERIRETKPDYLLILPWNIKDEVMEQMAHIREWGGQFVVPIPNTRVLS